MSGVYAAVSVSVPAASDPAGTLIAALPPLKATLPDEYPPPLNNTVPVATGLPLPPLIVTVAVSTCAVVITEGDGVTVTPGVIGVARSAVGAEVLAMKLVSPG